MALQPITFVLLSLAFLLELCWGAPISGCIAEERNALLNFKKNVEDKYDMLASWKDEDCCNWECVSCDNVTDHVVRLDFSYYNFTSALPQALKALKSLCKMQTLILRGVFFGGRMHEFREIFSGCLKDSIQNLDLSANELEGYLPNWLGELHMLKTLDLSNNKLNGTIPESIGQLSNLVILRLANNFFEGIISEVHFASIAKLKELDLRSNNLILNVSRDWIPPFKLNTIVLGSCKIGPKFPQWLQTQVNLTTLDLSSSGIVDSLPNWFWDLFTTLDHCTKELDLSENKITESLPHLPKLCFHFLDLSSNFFEGPLPPSFYSFSDASAARLDISNNLFSGSINPSICETSLVFISLSTNKFSGELPNCWNTHSEIEYLDFSGNNLSGNISPAFGNLTKIIFLKLANNILSGDLPSTISNCIHLNVLDLSYNNFKGKIPIWLGESFTSLWALVLESNNFTGTLPSNLSKLVSLRILYLGNNNLYGRIPRSFGNFKAMIVPDTDIHAINYFKENLQLFIKGRKYQAISEALDLEITMDLSCNKLSGQIPVELGNLRLLHSLNLSRNHLVGLIPKEIRLLHSLESLDLSRNGFYGNIPINMSAMTTLDLLNLSYNNLSGKIPLENQFLTFTNGSYIGNPKLCGYPLTQLCDNNPKLCGYPPTQLYDNNPKPCGYPPTQLYDSNKTTNVDVSTDEVTKSDWYVSIAVGFILGFWIVWVTFFLKKKWKEAYFQYADYVYDAIYVAITVNINRFKRKIGNETASG